VLALANLNEDQPGGDKLIQRLVNGSRVQAGASLDRCHPGAEGRRAVVVAGKLAQDIVHDARTGHAREVRSFSDSTGCVLADPQKGRLLAG
jgi:hypothetical protein